MCFFLSTVISRVDDPTPCAQGERRKEQCGLINVVLKYIHVTDIYKVSNLNTAAVSTINGFDEYLWAII